MRRKMLDIKQQQKKKKKQKTQVHFSPMKFHEKPRIKWEEDSDIHYVAWMYEQKLISSMSH